MLLRTGVYKYPFKTLLSILLTIALTRHKGPHSLWVPLTRHVQNRPIHKDRKQVRGCLGGWGRGDRDGEWLTANADSLVWWKHSGTRQRWWLHNIVNIRNTTELSTLKMVSFIQLLPQKQNKMVLIFQRFSGSISMKDTHCFLGLLHNEEGGMWVGLEGARWGVWRPPGASDSAWESPILSVHVHVHRLCALPENRAFLGKLS